MILQKEILNLSDYYGVPPDTIDKNWVLGHFIAELYKNEWALKNLVFKGGTCLKKCYLINYRFSEDLDFTLLNPDFVVTSKHIQRVCDNIEKNVGIIFSKVKIDPIVWNDNQVGYSSLIRFWGANHKRNQIPPKSDRWLTSIKIEIISYEKIITDIVMCPLLSFYLDKEMFDDVRIPCYSLSEIIAEKLRAILQRSYIAPRDYYDLWYLTKEYDCEWDTISKTFIEKCSYKNIIISSIENLFDNTLINTAEKAWNTSLAGHLPANELPNFNDIIIKLKEKLNNLKL